MTDERANRKMSAILSADVKGYSRLMSVDEEGTVKALNECRVIIARCVNDHRGRVVDSPGDNVLAEFVSTVEAVKCAVKIQEDLKVRNADLPQSSRMEFRIGVNLGDVIEEEDRIYGDGVNIAARLEGLAEAGGICISGTAFDQVKGKLSLGYQFVGKQTVKNIPDPVRAYQVLMAPEDSGKVIGEDKHRKWRWVQTAAVMLVLIAGAFFISNIYFGPPPIESASVDKMAFPLPDKPSIVVLPFDNMSGNPEEDYFSDGLTEQIITTLSRYPRLFVITRQSAFHYKGEPVKIQKVAEELGVRYVLKGGVQKSDNNVRITAQLIDALSGSYIWSERYDRQLEDIFDLQDEITANVLNGMVAELAEGEQARRWTQRVTNLNALESHYRAQGFFCRHTKEDYDKARPLFEEAIELEPNFVWPYVYLGYSHLSSAARGWSESRDKSLQTAFELSQKALAIDESHDGAHSLLAGYYNVSRQYDKAIIEAERAMALNPNAADAPMIMGSILGNLGRWEESALYAEKSIRLNPFPGAYVYFILGRAYFMTGQYDESIAICKKALKVSPNFLAAHLYLAASYSSLDRNADAIAAAKEVIRINPKFTIESYAKRLLYKNKADIDREVNALRKAGLPEKLKS
jgi:adenylate cyclase